MPLFGSGMLVRANSCVSRLFAGRARALRHVLASSSCLSVAMLFAEPVLAQSIEKAITTSNVVQFAIVFGTVAAAMISAIALIRERTRISAQNHDLRERVAELSSNASRTDALLGMRDQRVIIWDSSQDRPDLAGSLPMEAGTPEDRGSFLAFGRWLLPRSAAALDHAVSSLREKAHKFDLTVETQNGTLLEVQGRCSPRIATVRFLPLSQAQRGHAELRIAHQFLSEEHAALLALLDALETPVWLRDGRDRLQWVNRAYATAVDLPEAEEAVLTKRELLGTAARTEIAAIQKIGGVFSRTVSTVIGGDRRMLSVTDVAQRSGSAGIAIDMSEIEALRAEYERVVKAHAETLDQINTAIAIFDAHGKLRFFNQAFQALWDLDIAFLESAPDNTFLLDQLRSERKLAEQPEWRRWKENVLSAYRAVEPVTDQWYLPDGRTLRVVGNPQPQGGVTWVFENLTERIDLESRYRTAVRVQRETLDSLAEGVTVFGSDGRLRLSNPAFHKLWGLTPELARTETHISELRDAADQLVAANPWNDFVASVTGFDEERRNRDGKVELRDGRVLHHALIHLPNGQVMITFVDVTDSANIERALKDKNEALLKSEQLKNAFVQHVSYELRSPLTNIIGFTDLLSQPLTGPLQERQSDYVEHIRSSSSVLLTIVNDILDLATVDAGIMTLELDEVSIENTVASASSQVSERLREHGISLRAQLNDAPQFMVADENRLRQILVNLLTNAANFAPSGSIIRLDCKKDGEGVLFSVHDDGPGMSPDVLDAVFQRFEARNNGGRRRGAGLGLSIVKSFVELHGGTIEIDTQEKRGTTVICRFPKLPLTVQDAAE